SNFCIVCYFIFFFFSSRRRHTRCLSDWSSDVCSSDLSEVSDAATNRAVTPSPTSTSTNRRRRAGPTSDAAGSRRTARKFIPPRRSEEHTSELQSLRHLVCRLLLEKKKERNINKIGIVE